MQTHPLPSCPLCAAHDTVAHFADDSAREYLICSQCDLVFVPPQWHPTAETAKKRYDLHQNNPADAGYRRFLSQLADPMKVSIQVGAEGLDFGCGPTAALAMLFEEAGFLMSRYDPFYANDATVLERTYDFVASSEVVEHFVQPAQDWNLLLSLMKPAGVLGIMTSLRESSTDFARWWYRDDITHVCFYSRRTFEWLANHNKLAVEFKGGSVILLRRPGLSTMA